MHSVSKSALPEVTHDSVIGTASNIAGSKAASMATICPACSNPKLKRIFQRQFQGRSWHLTVCANCGLHFTDPIPSVDDISGFYVGDYHAGFRVPGAAERVLGPKFERYVSWIKSFLTSGRVLDVGCSTGLLPKMLHDAGYESEGIELNRENATWGSRHYGVPIRFGGLEDMIAPEASFDLVILGDVLEHTPNPFTYLRQVNRVLKTGGYALVVFPDIQSIESRYYWMLSRLLRRPWLWITCHIPGHTWEFTPKTASDLAKRAGFEIAGFRRSVLRQELNGWLRILSFPTRLLSIWPGRLGTQMEFMLRKISA